MPHAPQVVVDAVDEWKGDEDWLGNFVDEKCIKDPGKMVSLKDLYEVYTFWAKDNHIIPVGRKAFSHRVQMDSYRKDESNHHVGAQFIGLGLRYSEPTSSNSDL
jgi:putative DNA primase/helicase